MHQNRAESAKNIEVVLKCNQKERTLCATQRLLDAQDPRR